MKIKFITIAIILLFTIGSSLLSVIVAQDKMKGPLFIYFFDPYSEVPDVAVNYTNRNLQELFIIKSIKTYFEGKYTYLSAVDIAKEKECPFLIELKPNMIEKGRSETGYIADINITLTLYALKNDKPLLTATANARAEDGLSDILAYATALSEASKKVVNEKMDEILSILSK